MPRRGVEANSSSSFFVGGSSPKKSYYEKNYTSTGGVCATGGVDNPPTARPRRASGLVVLKKTPCLLPSGGFPKPPEEVGVVAGAHSRGQQRVAARLQLRVARPGALRPGLGACPHERKRRRVAEGGCGACGIVGRRKRERAGAPLVWWLAEIMVAGEHKRGAAVSAATRRRRRGAQRGATTIHTDVCVCPLPVARRL